MPDLLDVKELDSRIHTLRSNVGQKYSCWINNAKDSEIVVEFPEKTILSLLVLDHILKTAEKIKKLAALKQIHSELLKD